MYWGKYIARSDVNELVTGQTPVNSRHNPKAEDDESPTHHDDHPHIQLGPGCRESLPLAPGPGVLLRGLHLWILVPSRIQ